MRAARATVAQAHLRIGRTGKAIVLTWPKNWRQTW
jgi:hypothetical protein